MDSSHRPPDKPYLSPADAAARPWVLSKAGGEAMKQILDPNSPTGRPSEPSVAASEASIQEIWQRRVDGDDHPMRQWRFNTRPRIG
jgi:hypothetical protein